MTVWRRWYWRDGRLHFSARVTVTSRYIYRSCIINQSSQHYFEGCFCLFHTWIIQRENHHNKTTLKVCARAFEVDKQKRSMQAKASRSQADDVCIPLEHCSGILIQVLRQKESRLHRAQGVLHCMSLPVMNASHHTAKQLRTNRINTWFRPHSEQQTAADISRHLWLRLVRLPHKTHAQHCGRYTRRSGRRVRDKGACYSASSHRQVVLSWRTYVTCLHTAGSQSERLPEGGLRKMTSPDLGLCVRTMRRRLSQTYKTWFAEF